MLLLLLLLTSSPGLRISRSKVAPLWHIGRVSYNLENLENLELPGTRNLFNGTLVEGKCI